MPTMEVVGELLRRLASDDPEGAAEVYADEVDWQLNWPESEVGGAVPWIRQRATNADVAEHYRTINAHHDPAAASVHVAHVLVDGEHAVVLGTIGNTVRSTGRGYRAHFALHLTVENGEITRHHVYEDSLSVARAWYGP